MTWITFFAPRTGKSTLALAVTVLGLGCTSTLRVVEPSKTHTQLKSPEGAESALLSTPRPGSSTNLSGLALPDSAYGRDALLSPPQRPSVESDRRTIPANGGEPTPIGRDYSDLNFRTDASPPVKPAPTAEPSDSANTLGFSQSGPPNAQTLCPTSDREPPDTVISFRQPQELQIGISGSADLPEEATATLRLISNPEPVDKSLESPEALVRGLPLAPEADALAVDELRMPLDREARPIAARRPTAKIRDESSLDDGTVIGNTQLVQHLARSARGGQGSRAIASLSWPKGHGPETLTAAADDGVRPAVESIAPLSAIAPTTASREPRGPRGSTKPLQFAPPPVPGVGPAHSHHIRSSRPLSSAREGATATPSPALASELSQQMSAGTIPVVHIKLRDAARDRELNLPVPHPYTKVEYGPPAAVALREPKVVAQNGGPQIIEMPGFDAVPSNKIAAQPAASRTLVEPQPSALPEPQPPAEELRFRLETPSSSAPAPRVATQQAQPASAVAPRKKEHANLEPLRLDEEETSAAIRVTASPETFSPPSAPETAAAPAVGSPEASPAVRAFRIDLRTAWALSGASDAQLRHVHEALERARARDRSGQWQPPLVTTAERALHRDPGPVPAGRWLDQLAKRQQFHPVPRDERALVDESLLNVAQCYFELVESQALLVNAEAGLAAAGELAALVDASSPSPAVKSLSDQEQRHWLAQAELARRDTEAASERLAKLLYLDSGVKLAPFDATLSPLALAPESATLEALQIQAFFQRPELAGGEDQILARIRRMPRERWQAWFPDMARRVRLEPARTEVAPAFDAGTLMDRIASEVSVAASNIDTYREQLRRLHQEIRVQAEHYYEGVGRVKTGRGAAGELIPLLRARLKAHEDYIRAVASYDRCQARLLKALGRPMAERTTR